MRAGELRHEIVIEESTEVTVNGYTKRTWTEFCRIAAGWKEEAGDEIIAGDTVIARRRGYWKCRYLAGVTEKMRVKFEDELKDRYYQIMTVEDVMEKHRELRIRCFEMPVVENTQ
jgi:head-tail adaptor